MFVYYFYSYPDFVQHSAAAEMKQKYDDDATIIISRIPAKTFNGKKNFIAHFFGMMQLKRMNE